MDYVDFIRSYARKSLSIFRRRRRRRCRYLYMYYR